MNSSSILRTFAVLGATAASLLAQGKPVFQENFESGKIDPAVWEQRSKGTPTIAVEEVEGAHGKYALHVHYPDMASGSYAFIVATHLPDSVTNHFFGRAYVKIASAVTPGHNPLIFAGEPGWPISKFDEIGLSRRNWMPSYQENKSPAGAGRRETTYRSETNPPFDKWFLLEWEMNDEQAAIAMWIDGERLMVPVAGEKVDTVKFVWPKGSTDVDRIGGFKEFGFGARVWQGPFTAWDIYYDDIAIGTSRLGPAK